MDTDQLIALGTLLGSFFMGGSIWFAIYVYRADRDRSQFSIFRTSLIDIRTSVTLLEELLSERRFVEVGDCIVEELKTLIDSNATKEEIVTFFQEPKNHDLVATAIHMGMNHSNTVKEIESVTRALQRLPYVGANQIPLLRQVLSLSIHYAIKTAKNSISPNMFEYLLGKPEQLEKVVPEMAKRETPLLMFEELSLILSGASDFLLENVGQAVFDDIRDMLAMLVDKVSGLTDKELKALRTELASVTIDDSKHPVPIDRVLTRLDKMRRLFSASEWDSLVEAKARVQKIAHPSENK